jgi:hypothetical protein
MVGKAQKSCGVRSGLYGGCSDGVPPIHFSQAKRRINSDLTPWLFQLWQQCIEMQLEYVEK